MELVVDIALFTREYCQYCKERGICFRHATLGEAMSLVYNLSKFPYIYLYSTERIFTPLGGRWWVECDKEKCIIERPSGVKFTYRNKPSAMSYRLLVNMLVNFAEDMVNNWETGDNKYCKQCEKDDDDWCTEYYYINSKKIVYKDGALEVDGP
ncbi:MAG: hypothetical protein ACK4M3_06715 [Pyrobaculum sp.]